MRFHKNLGKHMVRYRWPIVIVLLVSVLPCLWVLIQARMGSSAVESFVESEEKFQEYLDEVSLFDSDVDAFLFFATDEGDQLFTAEKLDAIRKASTRIRELDEVNTVYALPDLPATRVGRRKSAREIAQISVLRDSLKRGTVPKTYRQRKRLVWPRNPKLQEKVDLKKLKESVTNDPRFSALVVSRNGRAQMMAVGLKELYEMDAPEQLATLRQIESILREEGLGSDGLYIMGVPALQSFNQEQIEKALLVYLPAGAIIVSLFIFLIFRRITIVLLILLIAAVANVWGIGIAIWFFGKFTILLVAVPLMVLVISTSDVIHLIAAYMSDVEHGYDNERAVSRMVSDVGGACVLTSLTTFCSFISLVLVPSQTMQQFGFGTAIGVGGALLLSITLTPICVSLFPIRPARCQTSGRQTGFWGTGIEKIVGMTITVVQRYHFGIVAFAIVVIGIAAWLSPRLHLDPDLVGRFSKNHINRKSAEYFNNEFSGIHTVEIRLTGDPNELYSPKSVRAMKKLEKQLAEQEGVAAVFSPATLFSEFDREIGLRTPDGLPESSQHALGVIAFVRKHSPKDVRRLVTDDNRMTRILVRLNVTPFLQQYQISEKLEKQARKEFGSEIEVRLSGSTPIFGQAVQEIVRGHYNGFALCSCVILISIIIALRSLRLGLLAVIPNLLPLAILLIILVIGKRADTDILAVATLSIGLAVDNTIHFLHRYQLEILNAKNTVDAIRQTLRYTGRAIIQATIVLSVGFLPFAFSVYSSLNMLGRHLVVVLIVALLADLFVLPSLILVIRRWKKQDLQTD